MMIMFYHKEEFEIKFYSGKAESGVPNQPFGNETYQGAYNRINHIREKYQASLAEQDIHVDFYISCEAGIDDTNKVIMGETITPIYVSEQIVCIYNPKNDSYSFGKSSSWTIPEKNIEEIKSTDLDVYLRKRECKGLHDVGDGEYITRKEAVREAMMSAIASIRFIERNNREKQNLNKKYME